MLGRNLFLTSCEINNAEFKPYKTDIKLLAGELKPMFLAIMGGVRGLGERQHKNRTH